MKKGFVYILRDNTGRFYVGSTSDVSRKIKQHRHGHTQTTARMTEPDLVLYQEYATLAMARKVERSIKKLKRRDYVQRMVEDGFIKMSTRTPL